MDLSRVAQGIEDLRSSLEYGVQPSLRACVQHGGGGCLLVLIRKVFAYVEFLGALWGVRRQDGLDGAGESRRAGNRSRSLKRSWAPISRIGTMAD
jgi:hypothetical protein